ncbi:hypothetical protein SAMN04487962_12532 [Marinobacter segnicrescens]|uniref:Uncharacterized protein n=1 Tax=Marinobacter segnicrescens TaxID=430453 RepID=A0A1I0H8N4_9GAMM|nr:hypothetical protein [Marinobacter segnicrescens]SET79977.1 hypothetical protein SAMN04487962_12532 [Marinobacter segnicrescens]
MAKATVLQNLGSGKYRIKIQKDLRGVSEKIDALTSEIESLDESIADKKTALELAEEDLKRAVAEADALGIDYDFDSDDSQYRSDYIDAQGNVTAYGKAVGNLREELRQLYASRLNASQNLEALQAIEAEKEVYCIAVDKSDAIQVGAEVSAIEHARDGNTTAYSIRQSFDPAQDSVIVPGKKMSAWSHLYAQLAQPAVLTQRPKYWFGVIRTIGVNGLLAEVDIYDRVIRSVSLSPKNSSLHTCDCDFLGSADFLGRFEVGDRVVVDFHFGSGTPTVIGFALDPGLDYEEEPYKPEPLPQPSGWELVDNFTLYLRQGFYQDPARGLVPPAWTTASDIDVGRRDFSTWRIVGTDDVYDPYFHRTRPYTKHRLITSTHQSCTPTYFYSQAGVGVDELNYYVRSLGKPIDFPVLHDRYSRLHESDFWGSYHYSFYDPVAPSDAYWFQVLNDTINHYLGDAHIYSYRSYQELTDYHRYTGILYNSVPSGWVGSKSFRYDQSQSKISKKRPRVSEDGFIKKLSGKIFGAENGFVRMLNSSTNTFENVSDYADCVVAIDDPPGGGFRRYTRYWAGSYYDIYMRYTGRLYRPIYN